MRTCARERVQFLCVFVCSLCVVCVMGAAAVRRHRRRRRRYTFQRERLARNQFWHVVEHGNWRAQKRGAMHACVCSFIQLHTADNTVHRSLNTLSLCFSQYRILSVTLFHGLWCRNIWRMQRPFEMKKDIPCVQSVSGVRQSILCVRP